MDTSDEKGFRTVLSKQNRKRRARLEAYLKADSERPVTHDTAEQSVTSPTNDETSEDDDEPIVTDPDIIKFKHYCGKWQQATNVERLPESGVAYAALKILNEKFLKYQN